MPFGVQVQVLSRAPELEFKNLCARGAFFIARDYSNNQQYCSYDKE